MTATDRTSSGVSWIAASSASTVLSPIRASPIGGTPEDSAAPACSQVCTARRAGDTSTRSGTRPACSSHAPSAAACRTPSAVSGRSRSTGPPARALGEDTLQRSRRVLGPDHPTTLTAAATLTGALARLGETEPARALGEDTPQRSRRVLGPDHVTTLTAAIGLTLALDQLGEVVPAGDLGEDTLQRSRRAFGPDHSMTLYLMQAVSIGRTRTTSANGDGAPTRPKS